MSNLQDYLSIKDAAEFLGVSQNTLRNWDHAGKIVPRRNPLNGYRLYKRSDLETFLKAIERPKSRRYVAGHRQEAHR
jgi:excisionase family DNA binding protein